MVAIRDGDGDLQRQNNSAKLKEDAEGPQTSTSNNDENEV